MAVEVSRLQEEKSIFSVAGKVRLDASGIRIRGHRNETSARGAVSVAVAAGGTLSAFASQASVQVFIFNRVYTQQLPV